MPDETIEEIKNRYDLWNLSFNANKCFSDFLYAVKNGDGLEVECKKIYDILDEVVFGEEREEFIRCINSGEKLYRARIIDPADYARPELGLGFDLNGKYSGYNEMNSCEPILGKGKDGRNNIAGMSYLYVASNEETACSEVKSQLGELISLAEFEVKRQVSIVDFSCDKTFDRKHSVSLGMSLAKFFSQLMLRYCEPVSDSGEYRATQLISEYIRKTGIDGIAYKSFLCPDGINYTIFHSHRSFIEFKQSRVLIHKQENHSFWDFNNDKAIFSNKNNFLMDYNIERAEEHKEHLKKCFVRVRLE